MSALTTEASRPRGGEARGGADVVVIGAGFAGLVATRELGRAGLGVLVLEARDRVGGRTWTDRRLGHDLELGGTWVHWVQPHTWAEMTRYGRQVTRSPAAEQAYWLGAGDAPRAGTLDEFMALIADGPQAIVDDVRVALPCGISAADGAVVTWAGGAEARARRVISTLPVNAIAGIEWEPGLPGAWQRANAETVASQGVKVWVKARGRVPRFFAYASQRHPISVLKTEFTDDDATVLVGICPDHTQLDVMSVAGVHAAVDALRPWRARVRAAPHPPT